MGMKRATTLEDVPTTASASSGGLGMADAPRAEPMKTVESGPTAALERLGKSSSKAAMPTYKARDYEAEAIGKTRCVQFEAALMSPAIAGMRFDTMDEYLKLVRQAADAGVAYSFEK